MSNFDRMQGDQPRPFSPRGAAELQVALQSLRDQLADVDRQLQEAHEVAEEAEERWVSHYDEVLAQIEEETNGRLPGEELRQSIARRRGGGEAWTNHRRAERAVKRLEKRGSLIGTRIGSCQSEAKLLGIA